MRQAQRGGNWRGLLRDLVPTLGNQLWARRRYACPNRHRWTTAEVKLCPVRGEGVREDAVRHRDTEAAAWARAWARDLQTWVDS